MTEPEEGTEQSYAEYRLFLHSTRSNCAGKWKTRRPVSTIAVAAPDHSFLHPRIAEDLNAATSCFDNVSPEPRRCIRGSIESSLIRSGSRRNSAAFLSITLELRGWPNLVILEFITSSK
jgi:hypothetical protein